MPVIADALLDYDGCSIELIHMPNIGSVVSVVCMGATVRSL